MAREFASASTQYLRNLSWTLGDMPISIGCWFWCAASPTTSSNLVTLYLASANYYRMRLAWSGGSPTTLRADLRDDGVDGYAATSTNFSTQVWQHACAVFASNVSRAIYLNGANKGTNTTDLTPTTSNKIYVADQGEGYELFTGSIAELAVWNIALTDDDAAMLADGFSPLSVKPANLFAYWPFVRDADRDWVNNWQLTAMNSPTVAAHCPKVRHVMPQFIIAPLAGITVPLFMHHYAMRRA